MLVSEILSPRRKEKKEKEEEEWWRIVNQF